MKLFHYELYPQRHIPFCATRAVSPIQLFHSPCSLLLEWTERFRSSRNKMEYNIEDTVRNETISRVQHLKTCITILRVFQFLKGRIWVFFQSRGCNSLVEVNFSKTTEIPIICHLDLVAKKATFSFTSEVVIRKQGLVSVRR